VPALGWLYARNPTEIPVRHEARLAGRSKYSLRRLLWLHLDLATGFSVGPLRFLMGLGGFIAGAGVLFGLFLLYMRITEGPQWAAEGVFTLFALLFIFVGAQFVVFGILGEYLGRIFMTVRERPAWVLREPAGDAVLHAPPAAAASMGAGAGTGTKSGSTTDPMFAPRLGPEQTLLDARREPRA